MRIAINSEREDSAVNRQDRTLPPHERLLLDEETASAMCSVSRSKFREWVAVGLLEPAKLPPGNHRKLYRKADVEAFVDSLR